MERPSVSPAPRPPRQSRDTTESALSGPLGPPPRGAEGAVARIVRGGWNLALSAIVGTMAGWIVHAFGAEAATTLFGPMSAAATWGIGLAAWAAGGSVAFVLFVSYYLDDSQR